MFDLMLREERNAHERPPQHWKATQSAVPLGSEAKMSTETRIRARKRRFSAAC